MSRQPNWPEGHAAKAENLIAELSARNDLRFVFLETGSGMGIAQKIIPEIGRKEITS
jgi:hypothetical protein